jgi:hypothetical protein
VARSERSSGMKRVIAFLLPAIWATMLGLPVVAAGADAAKSRVYVVAYPCAAGAKGEPTVSTTPKVNLYDQAFYGDSGNLVGINPPVTVTRTTTDTVEFYFDVRPGNYDASVEFPTSTPKATWGCGRNGPLVVIPGKDRHLFVAATRATTDWHAPGAVAGTLPMKGINVLVLVYDHPMHCGDDIRSYDPKTYKVTIAPHPGSAVIDDEAYYQNIHAYGKQDHTVAIEFSGALFSYGTVLLTATPDTAAHKPPLIEKDVTPEVLHAATARRADKLICIPGF